MKNKFTIRNKIFKIIINFFILSGFVFLLVYNNYIYVRYNRDLFQAFSGGSYKNFQFIDKDDDLYRAVANYISRENIKGKKSISLDIIVTVFFFIQTAQYVEVYFGKDNCADCINTVVYRHLPG